MNISKQWGMIPLSLEEFVSLCNTDLISFLKVLQNSLMKISMLGFYFTENFLFSECHIIDKNTIILIDITARIML